MKKFKAEYLDGQIIFFEAIDLDQAYDAALNKCEEINSVLLMVTEIEA